MGTVPSSAQGSPRYPRLGMKALPAAPGPGGSFSGQRWILGSPHLDPVCVGYLPTRRAMLLPAAQTGHGLQSLCPLHVRQQPSREEEEEEAEEMPASSTAGLVPPHLGISRMAAGLKGAFSPFLGAGG